MCRGRIVQDNFTGTKTEIIIVYDQQFVNNDVIFC